MCPSLCLPHVIISYNCALHLSNWRRIQQFGSETSLTVIAELSKEDLLELNHGTLTIIWYQIGWCHFAYTTESLVRTENQAFFCLKQPHSQPATNCSFTKGTFSTGDYIPCSISFNETTIVRNFYPNKFQSCKVMEIGKSQEFSEFQRAISTLDNKVKTCREFMRSQRKTTAYLINKTVSYNRIVN